MCCIAAEGKSKAEKRDSWWITTYLEMQLDVLALTEALEDVLIAEKHAEGLLIPLETAVHFVGTA